MKIHLRSILTGMLLVLVLVGGILLIKKNKPLPKAKPQAVGAVASVSLGAPKALGPDSAPVKLVEYSDFECPSCRLAQQELHTIIQEYPGKIQLIFKHFPLTSHRWSIYAHQAAECMNRQGKFWLYQDKLYEKQPEWSSSSVPPVEILVRYAKEMGANTEGLMACMADVAVTRSIYAEKEEGNLRQVNATPTLFLGEARYVGPKEMKERGENDIRKVLGLPPKPVQVEAPKPDLPAVPPAAPTGGTK